MTVANVLVMLPVELALHAGVLLTDLPYLGKVLLLTLAATLLAVWVVEPSAARLLRRWLHAPALRARVRLRAADSLWRVRAELRDEPGALARLTDELSALGANILDLQVQRQPEGALDELVVATPAEVREEDLLDAVASAGGRAAVVRPTTASVLADAQTRALSHAVAVADRPEELPQEVAELLRASVVRSPPTGCSFTGRTLLKIPSVTSGALVLARPGEPFTIAESARAHRLAELAELTTLRR
ncbi:ACT domain-containing protein [Ornithinimicrobium cerasi]|uniref:ACT domain-containing protein n=1 Tax=Ornithinimicrobium cerasi TaxID=2248773 RepID=A0A285W0B4_9MICO|nr:ACT domain-containing protein [Ornithinimicrobium cerasi]SOC58371.1 hypothetical protein SAMN05421879_1321 [Ornithinimicrobium cerasi]